MSVAAPHRKVLDLRPLQDAQHDFDPCITKRPDLAVKVREPLNGVSIHLENEITWLKSRFFIENTPFKVASRQSEKPQIR